MAISTSLYIHFKNNYPKLIFLEAKEESANIQYQAIAYGDSDWSYDENTSESYADPEKQYKNYVNYKGYYHLTDISYSWKFNDNLLATQQKQHGEYSYGKLTTGSANDLIGTCTASATEIDTYTKTEVWWEYIDNEIIGYEKDEITGEEIPIYKEPYYKEHSVTTYGGGEIERSISETVTLTVYTSPGPFTDYNFSSGTIIQSTEGLSTTKVSNWCTHAGKYLSWKDQKDRYDDANYLKVIEYFKEEKPIITAAWYNDCAELVGCTTRVSNDHSQANSLITAQIFKDLGAAISP